MRTELSGDHDIVTKQIYSLRSNYNFIFSRYIYFAMVSKLKCLQKATVHLGNCIRQDRFIIIMPLRETHTLVFCYIFLLYVGGILM